MVMAETPLKYVDIVADDAKPTPGLVAVHSTNLPLLSIDERVAVIDAASFKDVDYVFFRRFSDGRSSQVSAYIVDNSDERLNEENLAELHLQVWLHGTAPLLYIAWQSRIDILSCARGADFLHDDDECVYAPAKQIELDALEIAGAVNSELQRFSVLRLADGTFWEDPINHELADHSKAAHQSLIQAVVEVDESLDGKNNPILRRLLLLMVLIKYLEDRHVFPDNWFGKFRKGTKSFFEVLRGSNPDEVYRLLEFLERKFNGDIFALPLDQKLTEKTLRRFADLVEAKTLKQQRHLWKQFSFEHLPVEIISHLYQRFVQGGHGTVYTPPFLAALLLDHALPYAALAGNERVLDPACGSGVFLVGAFRRLVNAWRNGHDWQKPDVNILKGILSECIYGVELDQNAVDLTAFSLSLAVCDALQPDVIWRDLKFDRLRGSNLLQDDFFSVLAKSKEDDSSFPANGFDVVIGNPPFESELSEAGVLVEKSARKHNRSRGSLPDNQSAYLFLEQALSVIRPTGRICMIQPHGLLYNRKAQGFRAEIFRNRRVDTIFDFTSIRNMYDGADVKTIAILAHADEPDPSHRVKHWTFRRTISTHERISFELDHYDRHHVCQSQAVEESSVWRTNLLGGGRLFDIAARLHGLRTLAEYAKQMGWDYGEGFIVGNKKHDAPFLTGKALLPTTAFTEAGIDESKIGNVTDTKFEGPRREAIYTPPLILIKESESLPMAYWSKGHLAYRNEIVGIHAPPSQERELRKLYSNLRSNHRTYCLSCALNGARSLVGKATAILKQDIDILPYPEDMSEITLAFWEEALCNDVLDYMASYVRLGQNSELLSKAADTDSLKAFSSLFCKMLGSVYDNLQAADPVFLNGLTCQPFYFGECPNLSWLTDQAEDGLKALIYDDKSHECLRTIRVLRFYFENVILLIKPDRLRYWIQSTAIRDADETLVDLRRQGY